MCFVQGINCTMKILPVFSDFVYGLLWEFVLLFIIWGMTRFISLLRSFINWNLNVKSVNKKSCETKFQLWKSLNTFLLRLSIWVGFELFQMFFKFRNKRGLGAFEIERPHRTVDQVHVRGHRVGVALVRRQIHFSRQKMLWPTNKNHSGKNALN